MNSPYPLPPGCIFREDFKNPMLAAQNGLTGLPVWIPGGVRLSTANLSRSKIANGQLMTVIVDAIVLPANGNYHSLINQFDTVTSGNEFNIGLDPTNKMFWSVAIVTVSSSVVTPGRRMLYWTSNGANGEFFVDGVSIGTRITDASVPRANPRLSFGAYLGVSQRSNHPITQIRLYNYAMTASEIAADYRTVRGIQ